MDPEHYLKLKRMYEGAPCNRELRPEITIEQGHAELRMQATPALWHAANAVHGSYYFKMLDDAAFFAANSLVTDVFVLTASFNIQLLRPVTGGMLRAAGRTVRSGKTLIFAESALHGETGDELARGSGVFARSNVKLVPEIGYR